MNKKYWIILFLILGITNSSAFADSSFVNLYKINGDSAYDGFGKVVAFAGDVNGDGYDDFMIGAPEAHLGGQDYVGYVCVYSGATGTLLYRKQGTSVHDYFGSSLSGIGDINGDNRDDFIIGAPSEIFYSSGAVYVYSGATGNLICQINGVENGDNFGKSASRIEDLNSDGKEDFIVGAPGTSVGGSFYIYSGATCDSICQINHSGFGYAVAEIGDLNADGKSDFIVGFHSGGISNPGSAHVYSGGQCGDTLCAKEGAPFDNPFGRSVAGLGDLDGDGKNDFIVGAGLFLTTGQAYIYSGADCETLFVKDGGDSAFEFGSAVAGVGDANGDGQYDFIVGASRCLNDSSYKGGAIFLYSGAAGTLLAKKEGANSFDYFGTSVAGGGDVDSNGSADFIVGAPGTDINGSFEVGTVYVYGMQGGIHDLGFRPNPDGWGFPNDCAMWENAWNPFTDPWDERCGKCESACDLGIFPNRCFPTWELFTEAFGKEQTEHPNGKRCKAAEKLWDEIKQCFGGSCLGFATSSFLFYDHFLEVSKEFPTIGQVYQVPINDKSRNLINKLQLYQYGQRQQHHINQSSNSKRPSETLQEVITMLSSTVRDDKVLVLINTRRSGRHAVNPYKVEIDPNDPNIHYIYVYDNRSPGDETKKIVVNTSPPPAPLSDYWSYDGFQPGWSGNGGLLLMEPVSGDTMKSILPFLCNDAKSGLATTSATSPHLQIFVSSSADALFESPYGEIGKTGDSLFSSLTDGIPIIPITGYETPPIGYYLPNGNWRAQFSNNRDSSFHFSVFTDSTVIAYSRSQIDSTQHEEFNYFGDNRTIVVSNTDSLIHSYNLETIAISPDSEIVIGIRNIATAPNDSTRYSITTESGLKVDNFGDSSTYNLRIEVANASGSILFFHPAIEIDSNTSHKILPNWRENNDTLTVLIDRGITGIFSDSIRLENLRAAVKGDLDADGSLSLVDLVLEINCTFLGQGDCLLDVADVNCDGLLTGSDVVLLLLAYYLDNPFPCP